MGRRPSLPEKYLGERGWNKGMCTQGILHKTRVNWLGESKTPQWGKDLSGYYRSHLSPVDPLGKMMHREKYLLKGMKNRERSPLRQESPSPEQRIVEADRRHQKRLATLARDHIVKLREEREQMACGWLGEYAE